MIQSLSRSIALNNNGLKLFFRGTKVLKMLTPATFPEISMHQRVYSVPGHVPDFSEIPFRL